MTGDGSITKDVILAELRKRTWQLYGGSGWPFFLSPWTDICSRDFKERYGIANDGIMLGKEDIFEWIFDSEQLTQLARQELPSLLEQGWKFYDDWMVLAGKFAAFHYELMDMDLSGKSDDEIKELAEGYWKVLAEQYVVNNLVEPLSFFFQEELHAMLVKDGLSDEEADELAKSYGVPARSNYIKDCLAEYSALKDKEDTAHLLKRYHYLNNDFTGPKPFTDEVLKELVSRHDGTAMPDKPVQEVKNKKAKALLDALQITATVQDVRKAYSLMWISGSDKIMREFASRRSMRYENLLLATWEEVIEASVTDEELAARKERWVLVFIGGTCSVFTADDAGEIMDEYSRQVLKGSDEVDEIKGVSASNGKVTGRVVVVMNMSHFHKVKKGDILVAMMTRPEYLPVMSLASAFVTDEGGITCHAAIVAREMKKPCIINTKVASKVLRDNDIVEVDADKGIVRIIKRVGER